MPAILTSPAAEKLRLCALVFSLSFLGANLALAVIGVSRTVSIPNVSMTHLGGYGYVAPVRSGLWLLTSRGDDGAAPRRSRTILRENGVALEPAHSLHEDIQRMGAGRYSHWAGDLLFSSSDNSDPRTNGRTYEVVLTLEPKRSMLGVAILVSVAALAVERRRIRAMLVPAWGGLLRVPGIRWSVENVLPGLGISVVAVIVLLLIGEAYLRLTVPFLSVHWPFRFDPEIGFRFEPNSVVQHTNHLNFWVRETTNSLGFLDREPLRAEEGERRCGVTFLGDSFVEAAQVPIELKVQVVFERMARSALPSLNIRANAFGYSGTGQLNQLPFYDRFARSFRPKMVVLVIVANDLANNSYLLESIRNGWDPSHLPRQFARYDEHLNQMIFLPIDVQWSSFLLPRRQLDADAVRPVTHRFFIDASYFYNWLFAHLSLRAPVLAASLRGDVPPEELYRHRIMQLRARPEFATSFSGWDFARDGDMDLMFNVPELPPAFQEAVKFTGFALDQFVIRARRDGFHLLGLVTKSWSSSGVAKDRFAKLLTERGIPFVDEEEYLRSRGVDPRTATFKNDGHWSPRGHAWAAEAVADYVVRHQDVCQ